MTDYIFKRLFIGQTSPGLNEKNVRPNFSLDYMGPAI